ncbi:hypothetical protein, partial [uncultured Dubosiella sp.]|uniref:hypothetical protein n=1 Tax=uncultured Dubosiella sp. TaxID=1937011 RepID=UPI00262B7B78
KQPICRPSIVRQIGNLLIHYTLGTSEFNEIEYELFSYQSKNLEGNSLIENIKYKVKENIVVDYNILLEKEGMNKW